MTNLDLARLQFATTSIYHFLFVPVTIGLAFLVALLHTTWYRRRDEAYLRLTRFFGTLLVINIAIGVVTGLVQEFQFGMNWSAYSRFVGDVFGAPLAIEGLAAFFLESTFLGLWIFGWGRLSERVAPGDDLDGRARRGALGRVHHGGELVDAAPGRVHDQQSGRRELTSIWAVLTNPVFVWGYIHVLLASLVTGAVVMLAVSAWHLRHGSEPETFRRTAALSLVVLLPATLFAMMVGQPPRRDRDDVPADEGRGDGGAVATCQPCSFSVFQIGGGKNDETPTKIIAIPHLLSLLADDSWNGQVEGLNELNQQYQQQYGPGTTSRTCSSSTGRCASWRTSAWSCSCSRSGACGCCGGRRRSRRPSGSCWLGVWAAVVPFLMNTAGWMLTENGRQPWIVQGLQLTRRACRRRSARRRRDQPRGLRAAVRVLAVVDWTLMVRYSRK